MWRQDGGSAGHRKSEGGKQRWLGEVALKAGQRDLHSQQQTPVRASHLMRDTDSGGAPLQQKRDDIAPQQFLHLGTKCATCNGDTPIAVNTAVPTGKIQ
mmetsp:Transcript_25872/g.52926  ORF Transcript_25872/g.52926 Transcript_25872/m.52926 type:complete len:99 (-) Transcript_25872:213-509(-)|eukprot:CAMPEP_0183321226 /NCGR_PEP_ID=MMETSP0160_2-20130417/68354_1 /TAXON_ID=2839 ORGANISM="Odontella Sinensis, Strain Grunow 1884" /NCGR_SAMPLE_ID=MMETSP0160_2 /ASSEMBLY_ACC=CAM_ASM_000250 /LENGTH=98 /DNA_ID=CAMNT_0025488105 /DNA_START=503 /DNA_END=799 /DNA_ORIENTATION=+